MPLRTLRTDLPFSDFAKSWPKAFRQILVLLLIERHRRLASRYPGGGGRLRVVVGAHPGGIGGVLWNDTLQK